MSGLLRILSPHHRTYHWLHADTAHPIRYPGLTDRELAGKVRMLTGSELEMEPLVCAARDRIVHLTEIIEAARAHVAAAIAASKGTT